MPVGGPAHCPRPALQQSAAYPNSVLQPHVSCRRALCPTTQPRRPLPCKTRARHSWYPSNHVQGTILVAAHEQHLCMVDSINFLAQNTILTPRNSAPRLRIRRCRLAGVRACMGLAAHHMMGLAAPSVRPLCCSRILRRWGRAFPALQLPVDLRKLPSLSVSIPEGLLGREEMQAARHLIMMHCRDREAILDVPGVLLVNPQIDGIPRGQLHAHRKHVRILPGAPLTHEYLSHTATPPEHSLLAPAPVQYNSGRPRWQGVSWLPTAGRAAR